MNYDWAECSAVTTAEGYNYFMQMHPVTKRSGGMPFLIKDHRQWAI